MVLLSTIQKNTFIEDKIHFISYGDKNYEKARQRIYNEAVNSSWFYSVTCYDRKSLSPNFFEEFKSIFSFQKGGGYWIWKFDIILKKLEEIDNNDFLIYTDSGCTVNINGTERLKEYIKLIKNDKHKIISFVMGVKEKEWTTKEIFDTFEIKEDDPLLSTRQYIGGILIMQKCDAVINIFKDCLDKIRKDPLIITDYYNSNQKEYFKNNRNDQSILSVCRKLHGSVVISDETFCDDFNSGIRKSIPFLATRKRK